MKYIFSVGVLVMLLGGDSVLSEGYSQYLHEDYPRTVYWGDTHLHTKLSYDAYNTGNRELGLEAAYRFARGDRVDTNNGAQARLNRPLDFLVIADHAEAMGFMQALAADNSDLLRLKSAKKLSELLREVEDIRKTDPKRAEDMAVKKLFHEGWPVAWKVWNKDFLNSTWGYVCEVAERYNDPGIFTTLIGYEWLGGSEAGSYHRVVVFGDGVDRVSKTRPFTVSDSANPEALWAHLLDYERLTGGQVLAIPHNSNLSTGTMFTSTDFSGSPVDNTYGKSRSYWEPLMEITQIKGDSEAHPLLSPTDEFSDYETWNSWKGRESGIKLDATQVEQKRLDYARPALKRGLLEQGKTGVNPFKFGFIGSTDAHTSLSTAEEDNYWGKMARDEPSSSRMTKEALMPGSRGWEYSAAGYAGVWAQENTRESLFAAMKRKEVYASTGPRISVRFFGGWNFQANDAFKPNLARIGYRQGVPMGGDLANAPKGKAPTFLIRAVKDPDGANLDRAQVIKGWLDQSGTLHEKVYNVALSDGRADNSEIKAVGSTVDIERASYTNTIGDPELAVVWRDPDFNPQELSFYYLRVIEIPTPRWTAYDARYFGLKNLPDDIPMTTQERAYSSPIWYTPDQS